MQHLTAVLAQANISVDVGALRALLRGVVAAPVGERPQAWMGLLGDRTTFSAEVVAQLEALRRVVEAEEGERAAMDALPVQRVAALRAQLVSAGVDGFLIPRADEQQGEYVPKRSERLNWLTGFTGSAGVAVVLRDKAAIFVDGRYTLQVGSEVDTETFAVRHLVEQPVPQWLSENLKPGQVLGFDPWLHTRGDVRRLTQALRKVNATLKPLHNLVDAVWKGQPAAPLAPVEAQPEAFAGKTSAAKRAEVAKLLVDDGVDALVISAPDVVAWLLNIRGADVPYTPLPLGFAILHRGGEVDVFMDARKLVPGLAQALGDGVKVGAPEAFGAALRALGDAKKTVQMDELTGAMWIYEQLSQSGAQVRVAVDPCMKLKACKNEAEAAGTRAAHLRDGVAMARFLCWLDGRLQPGQSPLDEIEASDKLYEIRRMGELFRDLSFPRISGAGPNGAIVHYRASDATKRRLKSGSLYLIDSGAQYQDGTTDITRTVAVGEPTQAMREHFTLVLKGHINLSMAVFPVGTTGSQLDVLARRPLWERGLDYDHGTGHGVGSFLSVHEGPQRISKVANTTALQPGMILSNEPGYYKAGEYGIRVENLVMVQRVEVAGSEREMLGFETLTLAPIDKRLVAVELLSDAELDWFNGYQARVREVLSAHLEEGERAWLRAQTEALARG